MYRFFLVAGVLLLCACGGGETPPVEQDKRLVVCTTGMVGDLVRHVAGDRAEVISLMGPGVDPHYYKATQGDLQNLSRADVIFYNGLFLEGKLEGIFEKMARSKTVIPVSRDIPKERLRKPVAGQGEHDPHIWFDVRHVGRDPARGRPDAEWDGRRWCGCVSRECRGVSRAIARSPRLGKSADCSHSQRPARVDYGT